MNIYHTTFDVELSISILIEEGVIDRITGLELGKSNNINSIVELFLLLHRYGVLVDSEIITEIAQIYDIISQERIVVGNYRLVKIQSPSKVRSLIGKWNPPVEGQMKISDVVNDIFIRITENTEGVFYYYTGRAKNELLKGRYAYKLIIYNKIAIFVDLNRQISYHIKR